MDKNTLIQLWFRDDYVEHDGSSDDASIIGVFTSLDILNAEIKRTHYDFREPMEFKSMEDRFTHKNISKTYNGDYTYWVSTTVINKL